jgi:hypothetical protein
MVQFPAEDSTMQKTRSFFLPALLLLLTACAADSSNPARTIEAYFKALTEKDAAKTVSLSCAAWEASAQTDADTFAVYPATLENVACREMARTGDTAEVSCSGKMVLDYNGDKQEIDLADRAYLAKLEGGEWRMCGYQ